MSDDKTFPDRSATPDPHRAEPPVHPEAEHTRAGTSEPAVRPDHQEDLGPVGALLSTTGQEAASEAGIADAGTEAELAAKGVETEGVEGAQILAIMGITVVAIAVAVVVAIAITFMETGDTEIAQASDATYITGRQINSEDEALLLNYRVVDREAGVYGLPIGAAMERVVATYAGREGLTLAPADFNSIPQIRAVSAVPVRADAEPMPAVQDGIAVPNAIPTPPANEVMNPAPPEGAAPAAAPTGDVAP